MSTRLCSQGAAVHSVVGHSVVTSTHPAALRGLCVSSFSVAEPEAHRSQVTGLGVTCLRCSLADTRALDPLLQAGCLAGGSGSLNPCISCLREGPEEPVCPSPSHRGGRRGEEEGVRLAPCLRGALSCFPGSAPTVPAPGPCMLLTRVPPPPVFSTCDDASAS